MMWTTLLPSLYALAYLLVPSQAFTTHRVGRFQIRLATPERGQIEAGVIQRGIANNFHASKLALRPKRSSGEPASGVAEDSVNISKEDILGIQQQSELEAAEVVMRKAKQCRCRQALKRCKVRYTDADTMLIDIPPYGMHFNEAMVGFGSMATLSFLAELCYDSFNSQYHPSAFYVIAMGPPSAFFAGLWAKMAFCDPFVSSHLSIGEFGWSLERRLLGVCVAKVEGSTADISQARVQSANFSFESSYKFLLQLYTEFEEPIEFGQSLFEKELGYVPAEIDNHIKFLKAKSKVEACIASINNSAKSSN